MSLLEIVALVIAAATILAAYHVSRLRAETRVAVALLKSLDEELFHVAQEQNPHYGSCTRCGRRAVVRHVVPRGREEDPNSPDPFYCQRCWWLSADVLVAGDEARAFKDRLTKEDKIAAAAGPG